MVLLKDITGHDDIIKNLGGALISGRVSHAYLFSGPEGVGKMTTAMAFAAALMCQCPTEGDGCGECDGCRKVFRGLHPDVSIIRPDGSTVKINQIRQLTAGVQMGPATGRWTVRIVDGADLMTVEAANSMLKTLEEPLPGVIIILVAARPQALLPTIISRCQHMYFQPLLKYQLVQGMIRVAGVPEEEVLLAASLAGGSMGKALGLLTGGVAARDRAYGVIQGLIGAPVEEILALAGDCAGKREDVVVLLEMIMVWFRDAMLYNETDGRHLINWDRVNEIQELAGCLTTGRILEIINDIERAKGSLAASANIQIALEALFLRLAGKDPDVVRLEEVF